VSSAPEGLRPAAQGPADHGAFNLSAWALNHKPLIGFLMVIALFAGFSSYKDLGRDEDPPFTIKTMVVRAMWPGADAIQTAKQVTDRLEKPLESLEYIDFVTSFTKPGEATIMVNLRDDTPPSAVPGQWYQVRKKLGDIRGQLPQGAIGPFFNDDFGDVYGVIYALTSDGFTYRELRDQAEFIRAELLRVDNVGKVDLIGVQDEVIYIDFSLRQMAGLGIDPDLVAATLASQNAVIASGTIETPGERIMVRVSGALDSAQALENVVIRVGDRQVRLRDFARITRGYEDPPSPKYRVNGEPAIGIGVSMAKGGNVLDLGAALEKELLRIESDVPIGIDLHRVANQPAVVEESVGHFTRGLFEAIAIVLIVSLVSLGLRAGLVVAISIPLVLAITFVFMEIFGISLQRISLGALIIALGLLVDDAMIAVEMMVKKMEEGWDKFRAATFAYTSTAFPMLTGTLVSCAGFLPVGFAKSSAGEYCFTLFAVVTIALLVSWVVAVIFTPYIGVAVLKEQASGAHAHAESAPTITVQSKIGPGLQAATVNEQLDAPIGALVAKLPPGYRIEVGGAAGESAKGSASIMAVIPVMFLLMLFILMLQLHSTQKLFLVMLTAPLAIIGVTLALLLSNRPFGFVAMLGVFALVGMIIRNAVVLMAQIKENEDAGMERGAAIVEATMHRLRPILLTAAAAILGLIPIVREVFWGPMAIAMMGGLFIATILTLIFLPALYAGWYRVGRPVVRAA
jgi:multidrug efflux pump subunit AcrB